MKTSAITAFVSTLLLTQNFVHRAEGNEIMPSQSLTPTHSAPQPVAATAAAPAGVAESAGQVVLANGFVRVEFNKTTSCMDSLAADFSGHGAYGGNLLAAGGIGLQVVAADGKLLAANNGKAARCRILKNNGRTAQVRIESATDGAAANPALTVWTLTLEAGSRKVRVETTTVFPGQMEVKSVALAAHLRQWFFSGLFERGVMQNIHDGDRGLSSASPLTAFYTMDNTLGSVAIVPIGQAKPAEVRVMSGGAAFASGLEWVLAGASPVRDAWSANDWSKAADTSIAAGQSFSTAFDIYPNNLPFPTHTLEDGPNMMADDLRAFYTAVYGSAAGCLGSFQHDGAAYPTISRPEPGYSFNHTFFDPDAWSTTATLAFSGDPYLQNEARRILELSERNMKPDGQIPHHFNPEGVPTYIALSGATQTGPNIFWLLAANDYVAGTGDMAWMKAHYGNMKKAADWLFRFYDPKKKLLNVVGPLFVDVFIRNGYTLDSNAFLLRLLPVMAQTARVCGDPAGAALYEERAQEVKEGLELLWNGDNHYITQLNPNGTKRDMVDYDGNLAIVAFGGITDPARVKAVMARIDGGKQTHPNGRPTWPSEIYYGPKDCYNGNTGDSDCAMARFWWVDGLARKQTGDLATFNLLYNNVRDDLFQHTWLTERYNGSGGLYRAEGYHEYPEILTLLMREGRYGIDLKPETITVDPFGVDHYDYAVGDLTVSYTRTRVVLHVPGSGSRTCRIGGLLPGATYHLQSGEMVVADANGMAQFQGKAGVKISLSLAGSN